MTDKEFEEVSKLITDYLPLGLPKNEDTFYKLISWVHTNIEQARLWKVNPPDENEEERIYNIFGCTTKFIREWTKNENH